MTRFAFGLATLLVLAGCVTAESGRPSVGSGGSGPGLAEPAAQLAALQGDYFALVAPQNGRRYDIHVRFPDGYDPAAQRRYPTVYLLDGDSLFPLLAPTHLFLTYDESLPEAIIVGIAYGGFGREINKRHIDFSAPAPDSPHDQDGAPEFLAFLKHTLIPRIETRYRADAARRVLLGQSRGGYFVLWSALEDPDLFWGRIASNPTLDPGRARFFAAANPHARHDLQVAVATGTRDTAPRQHDALEWARAWDGRADAPWTVRLLTIHDGTHAASIGDAYRQAMVWLFR